MTASPNLLPQFRHALGWIIQGLIGVLFLMLAWFVEDRYALISGTDVRIKVTRLGEETHPDGKTFMVCEFRKEVFRRGVTERLRSSNDPNPHCECGGSVPEWSAQPMTDSLRYAFQAFDPKLRNVPSIKIEIPIIGPSAWSSVLSPGDVIRLRRGDRVVLTTYRLPARSDSIDKADQVVELGFEIE